MPSTRRSLTWRIPRGPWLLGFVLGAVILLFSISCLPTQSSLAVPAAPGRLGVTNPHVGAKAASLHWPVRQPDAATVAAAEAALPVGSVIASPWQLEETIPGSSTHNSEGLNGRNLGLDAHGNVYALWEDDPSGNPGGSISAVRFAVRTAGRGWSAPSTITRRALPCGSCHGNPYGVGIEMPRSALAVEKNGTAHVVWLEGPGGEDESEPRYTSRSPAGAWSTPVTPCTPTQNTSCVSDADPPGLTVDVSGTVTFAFKERKPTPWLWNWISTSLPRNGAWSPQSMINTTAVDAMDYTGNGAPLSLAMDGAGTAYALWAAQNPLYYPSQGPSFGFASRPAGGSWTPSLPVSDAINTGVAFAPALAVDPGGNAYALWLRSATVSMEPAVITFAYKPAGGPWRREAFPDSNPEQWSQRYPAIYVTSQGDAYAVWLTQAIATTQRWQWDVRFSHRPVGGAWTPPEVVNHEHGLADGYAPPSIAVTVDGDIYAMWRGADQMVHLSRRGPSQQIAGQVTTLDPDYLGSTPPRTLPLPGVPVTLLRQDKILGRAIANGSGYYLLADVPITTDLVLSVTLEYAAADPEPFRVIYSQTVPITQAYLVTYPFTVTAGADNPIQRDILFTGLGFHLPDFMPLFRPYDLGVIYYHTWQAWALAASLNQTLDLQLPVDIDAYSTESGVHWKGSGTFAAFAGLDPHINIDVADSDSFSRDRPGNREWHEFGHHVMADMLGNLYPHDATTCPSPYSPGHNCYHYGYQNVSTTDSWTEGFAEFYSLLVGQNIAHVAGPWMYQESPPLNLEANYKAWDPWGTQQSAEEFAVSGLLWDLVDPADMDDATVMTNTNGLTTSYADCVQIDIHDLWRLIANPTDASLRSPAAPVTYTYIFDVKQLYDALKAAGVGAAQSRGSALSDLDELFVAHGFFADLLKPYHAYNTGEEIGRAAYMTYTLAVNGAVVTVPAQRGRRDVPRATDSYIAYQAQDAATGALLDVQDFDVDVRFSPPFDFYSYSFQQNTADTPGYIYVAGLPSEYDAEIIITAHTPGWVSTAPLTVSNALYYQLMAIGPTDHFLEHTFVMTSTLTHQLYLPLIIRDWTGQSSISASNGPALATSRPLQAHIPVPCAPQPVGPTDTPTPSATATDTATVTPTATDTETATRTKTVRPTFTATPTSSATATPTGSITATPTSTGTYSPTPTWTPTPTPTGTWTPTETGTATPTPTGSITTTPTATGTYTPTPTWTPTPRSTGTWTPTATPTNTGTATHTRTPTRTRTATQSDTATATPTGGGCAWYDSFSSPPLREQWHWVREDLTHWSLTERPSYLRITTQAGDLWMATNSNHNMLLQAGPPGDFEIFARLVFNPSQSYQFAGLIAYQDDDNYVLIGSAASDGPTRYLVFSYESGGQPPEQRFASMAGVLAEIHLKLTRAADIYTAYYSFDGLNWMFLGNSYTANLSNVQVGLAAWNGSGSTAPEIDADWDWFCLNPGSVPTWTPTITPMPTPTATATPTAPPGSWQTIFSDGFEGTFPGAWQRFGNPGWGTTTCRSYSGTHSAWPAAAGSGAVTPCANNYPNNLSAWLIYGPFDLTGASAAEVTFERWHITQSSADYFKWMASADNRTYYGWQISGDSGGWVSQAFDLSNVPGLGDLRGRSQVWIGFFMQSDATTTDQGPFLDDVVIRKRIQ